MIKSVTLSKGIVKLTATDGLIHKIGTEICKPSLVMLPSDTIDMYEEVAEAPAYTKEEYKAKVVELIRERYDANKEFEIQREMICAMVPEAAVLGEDGAGRAPAVDPAEAFAAFRTYNAYVEECRARAKAPETYNTTDDEVAEG